MRLTNIENMNPDYLQEIKTLLIKSKNYLMLIHKNDRKYIARPTDIKYQYNHIYGSFGYPKITTKIVIDLLSIE